ncbi:MAG TPA: VTT domain-containing protein [Chitinophagaceae bacterium]
MKRIGSIFLFMCLLIIAFFILLNDAEQWIEVNLSETRSKFLYAIFSFGVLVSDIVLPVPSSLVMILNGKVLGIAGGAIISLVASQLASLIGFYMGRKASPVADRIFSLADKEKSNRLFGRYGKMAIVISKALPVISEAMSIIAGTTSTTFKEFFIFSLAGNFIVSVTYAITGSIASSVNSNIIAGIVIGTGLIAGWVLHFLLSRKHAKAHVV